MSENEQFFMNLFVTLIAISVVWGAYDRYKEEKK